MHRLSKSEPIILKSSPIKAKYGQRLCGAGRTLPPILSAPIILPSVLLYFNFIRTACSYSLHSRESP